MSKDEIVEIARQAERNAEIEKNTTTAKAIDLVRGYQTKIVAEIKELKWIIKENKDEESSPSFDSLKQRILIKMDFDLEISENIKKLQDLPQCSIPIRTNKISDEIVLAREFIEKYAEKLYNEVVIEGYDFEKPEILNFIQYNESSIWGSAKAVQLQVGLFCMAMEITNRKHFADIELQLYQGQFADETAIAHIEPFPQDLSLKTIEGIKDFSWFFSDNKTSQGLLAIPGGYTFGGRRGSQRNPRTIPKTNNEQPTHDCSSFVADVCEIQDMMKFSTADQYLAYKVALNSSVFVNNSQYSPNDEIVKNFEAIEKFDPQKDFGPNIIYARRSFNIKDDIDSLGVGGHTGCVLGVTNEGKVAIISTMRAIDTKKDESIVLKDKTIGYGVQECSLTDTQTGEMFMRPFYTRFKEQKFSTGKER